MATLSANSRRNSLANDGSSSSPTRSLSPMVSLEERNPQEEKLIEKKDSDDLCTKEISNDYGPSSLNLDDIEKDSTLNEKFELNDAQEAKDDESNIKNDEHNEEKKNFNEIKDSEFGESFEKKNFSSDDLLSMGERKFIDDNRLGNSSEIISVQSTMMNEKSVIDYLGSKIEYCSLSKSEPDDIYLLNNNVIEVSDFIEGDREETYPSSIVEPSEEIDSTSRRSTAEIVNATIIEEVNLNGFKDSNLKRTRACSERSDSGISDCSTAPPYPQGGELSSLIIAEEEDEDYGGMKIRTVKKNNEELITSTAIIELKKSVPTNGTKSSSSSSSLETIENNLTNKERRDFGLRFKIGEESNSNIVKSIGSQNSFYYNEFSRPELSNKSTLNILRSTYCEAVTKKSKPKFPFGGSKLTRDIIKTKFERSKSIFETDNYKPVDKIPVNKKKNESKTEIFLPLTYVSRYSFAFIPEPEYPPVKVSISEPEEDTENDPKTVPSAFNETNKTLESLSDNKPNDSLINLSNISSNNAANAISTNTETASTSSTKLLIVDKYHSNCNNLSYFSELSLANQLEGQESGLTRLNTPRVNTGSVSRTARMFEKEELPNAKEIPTSLPRVTPSVPGKPHNDRIQKAFAFWNK